MKFNHAPIYDVLHLRSEDVFFKYINSTNVLLLWSDYSSLSLFVVIKLRCPKGIPMGEFIILYRMLIYNNPRPTALITIKIGLLSMN